MSKIILSVIIPKSQEAELTFEMAQHELKGIEHEILVSENWITGLKKARGEYVCFLEKDCLLTPRYFAKLLENFENKPSFRKLALVAPTTGVNSYENKIYGLKITPNDIYPSFIPSSSSSYLVQAAYFPGSIIRRATIGDFIPLEESIILNSVNLSLWLWHTGQRVMIDPKTLYISTDETLDGSTDYFNSTDSLVKYEDIMILFRRESIG
jgi:hypothetical protein